jgi:hypothetical protein
MLIVSTVTEFPETVMFGEGDIDGGGAIGPDGGGAIVDPPVDVLLLPVDVPPPVDVPLPPVDVPPPPVDVPLPPVPVLPNGGRDGNEATLGTAQVAPYLPLNPVAIVIPYCRLAI